MDSCSVQMSSTTDCHVSPADTEASGPALTQCLNRCLGSDCREGSLEILGEDKTSQNPGSWPQQCSWESHLVSSLVRLFPLCFPEGRWFSFTDKTDKSARIQTADQFIFQSIDLLRKIFALTELFFLFSIFSEWRHLSIGKKNPWSRMWFETELQKLHKPVAQDFPSPLMRFFFPHSF